MGIKYRMTMTPEQAKAVNYACELYMRLKLGQYEELPFALVPLDDQKFCEKRDEAKEHLKPAFDAIFKDKKVGEYKDDQWHRLYNIHQVVRHAIWQAELRGSVGTWSYEPMDMGGVGMPEIEIIEE